MIAHGQLKLKRVWENAGDRPRNGEQYDHTRRGLERALVAPRLPPRVQGQDKLLVIFLTPTDGLHDMVRDPMTTTVEDAASVREESVVDREGIHDGTLSENRCLHLMDALGRRPE